MIELPKDGLFRIKLSNGKYVNGDLSSNKIGKVWNGVTHLNQHIGQYFYRLRRTPEVITHFLNGALIVNEKDNKQWEALLYIKQRFDQYNKNRL